MAVQARLKAELVSRDADGIKLDQRVETIFTPALLPNGERLPVTLTLSASTTVPVPSGSTACWINLNAATGITLKGLAGDTGIAIAPTSNPITAFPVILPLGSQTNLVFTSTSASNQTIEILFL